MKRKITVLFIAAAMLSSILPVSAGVTGDMSGNNMVVNIDLPDEYKDQEYSMFVFNPGMDENDMKPEISNKTVVQYFYQGVYSGSEDISIKLNTSNVNSDIAPQYKVLVTVGDYQETQIISAYSDSAKKDLLSRINGMSSTDTAIVDEVVDVFNLRGFDLYCEVGNSVTAKKLALLIKDEKATNANIGELFKEAVLLGAVDEGKTNIIENGKILNNDILGIDAEFENALADVTAEGINKLNTNISGNTYSDIESLAESVKEECILRAIYDHNELGSGHVNGIISDFSLYLQGKGVNTSGFASSNQKVVESGLIASGEKNFTSMVAEINSLIAKNKGTVTQTGSSSGSSSSGGGRIVMTPSTSKNDPVVANEEFPDLDSVPWAREYINALKKLGVISGRENGNFDPGASITRAEFTKIIVDALSVNGGDTVYFEDVSGDSWYYPYIQRAAGNGIIFGFENKFSPDDNIKREDVCAIAFRTIKAKGIDISDKAYQLAFGDTQDISDYALESVKALNKSEVVNGDDQNNFNPQKFTTRAEAAVIMYKLIELVGNTVPQQSVVATLPQTGMLNAGDDIISKLVRLGILSSESASNITKNVTRGEFAKMLTYYVNMDEVVSQNPLTEVFDDVMVDNEFAGYINFVCEQGYMTADGDRFKPGENITGVEVVKSIVRVLGYETLLSENADDNEYYRIASEHKITENVGFSTDKIMSVSDIAFLFDNSLDAEVLAFSLSGNGMKFERGADFLEAFHNIETIKGIMNGNNITTFASNESAVDGTVLVDSVRYDIDSSLSYMNDYLGYCVEINYKNNNGDLKILNFKPVRTNELVLSDDRIEEYSDGFIHYLDDAERLKKVRIASDAVIIYNGVAVLNYTADIFDIDSGSIELVTFNGNEYGVVKIYDYTTKIANGVSTANDIIYTDSGTYILEDYDNVVLRNRNGVQIALSEIKENNVLSVAASRNNEIITIIASDEMVSGVVNGILASENILKLGGASYKCIGTLTPSSEYIGKNVTAYLDYKGRVVAVKTDGDTLWNYGYIIKAVDDSGISVIKMYAANGKMVLFETENHITVDGEPCSAADLVKALSYNMDGEEESRTVSQLVRYKLAADGTIKQIDTCRGETGSDYLTLDISDTNRKYSSEVGRLVENKGVGYCKNNMRVVDSTVIFVVPNQDDITNAEDEDYKVITKSGLVNERTYSRVHAYNIDYDNGDAIGAMVIENSGLNDANLDIMSATILTEVKEGIDKNNECVIIYKGINLGTGDTIEIQANEYKNPLASYKAGDIFSYGVDDDDEVIVVSTEVDYGTTSTGAIIVYTESGNWNWGSGMPRVMSAYGVITHKNGSFINFAKIPEFKNGDLVRGDMSYDLANVRAYKFNAKQNELTVIDPHEVSDYTYQINQDATVYVYTNSAKLTAMVIYTPE